MYVYEPEQYDREVEQINEKNNMKTVIENNGVTDPFQQEVMMDDMRRDEAETRLVDQENMQDMMAMGEMMIMVIWTEMKCIKKKCIN